MEGLGSYNIKTGAVFGDAYKLMNLVSVGDEFLADTVVKKRGENSALAKRAVNLFGSLPSIVPGLHEEAAADLMATASVRMKNPYVGVVQLLLDVPMMQRSKHYYLNKIEEFFWSCNDPTW